MVSAGRELSNCSITYISPFRPHMFTGSRELKYLCMLRFPLRNSPACLNPGADCCVVGGLPAYSCDYLPCDRIPFLPPTKLLCAVTRIKCCRTSEFSYPRHNRSGQELQMGHAAAYTQSLKTAVMMLACLLASRGHHSMQN